MTKEEAIARIKNHKIVHKMSEPRAIYISEALDIAIKALEQEPCEDCISRKALLNEVENGIKAGNYEEGYEEYPHINDMDDIIECIKYADRVHPKAEQEPKTGYWIYNNALWGSWTCSECSFDSDNSSDYCPNCGARMREVEQ